MANENINVGIDTTELTPGAKFFVGISAREYQNQGTASSTPNTREAEDSPTVIQGTWTETISEYTANGKFIKNTSAITNDEVRYVYTIPDDGQWYFAIRARTDGATTLKVDIAGNETSALVIPTTAWADACPYTLIGPLDLTAGDISVKFIVNDNAEVELDRFLFIPFRNSTATDGDESLFPRNLSHRALKLAQKRGVLIDI